MTALEPELVVPGHRLPGTAANLSAITATRDYLLAFEEELGKAADGAALTEALVARDERGDRMRKGCPPWRSTPYTPFTTS
ncbi:hypothetical protein ABZ372_48785, partial [Streptomyces sp. NPDC005921]